MPQVFEINRIEDLIPLSGDWEDLLRQTPGASFFQSLPWLQIYWRHFGAEQKLRVLAVRGEDRAAGILPLVVRRENSKVGPLRVLTFPLHAWGSFYGPIAADPAAALAAGLEHIQRTRRDWDLLELRWQGAIETDPREIQRTMRAAGFQAYTTESDRTAVVDLGGTWEAYWSSRKGAWLRRFRHAERKLSGQGKLDYVRYRPAEKGDRRALPERPEGCFAQSAPVPLSRPHKARLSPFSRRHRTTTARPVGTSTTPAKSWRGEAGRRPPPTARPSRTSRSALSCAKSTRPPPRPALWT